MAVWIESIHWSVSYVDSACATPDRVGALRRAHGGGPIGGGDARRGSSCGHCRRTAPGKPRCRRRTPSSPPPQPPRCQSAWHPTTGWFPWICHPSCRSSCQARGAGGGSEFWRSAAPALLRLAPAQPPPAPSSEIAMGKSPAVKGRGSLEVQVVVRAALQHKPSLLPVLPDAPKLGELALTHGLARHRPQKSDAQPQRAPVRLGRG